MASFWSFSSMLFIFIALMALNFSLSSLASPQKHVHVSTISAAPTVLPGPPMLSPTLSPDIEPLFPTPGGSSSYPPSESSLPTIPSSPSPPNPDVFGASPGSVMAFPPSESMPASAPTSHAAPSSQTLCSVFHLALMVFSLFCIMQLHVM